MRAALLTTALATLAASPTQAQEPALPPEPICSFFVMMNVAVHHLHCTAENTTLSAELQTMLARYVSFISANSGESHPGMVSAVNTILTRPLQADYDCAQDARFVTVHDAFAADPSRVQPTADLHLSVDQPVVLDFDAECAQVESS